MSYLDAVAWALIHFMWQGAAIAVAAFAVQRAFRRSASARYATGVIAMAAMLLAPIVTVSLGATRGAGSAIAAPRSVAADAPSRAGVETAAALASPQAPVPLSGTSPLATTVILAIWSAGVAVLSARLLGGWFVARRFSRRSIQPASAEIQMLARRVAARLALDRLVGVFESTAVSVPVMVGWVKPVVLLPAAAMSGLSTLQVEALIAHELAHVRRHDYLVNLLQSAVETLLFYHPAVWWVSRRMRVDRELCCDDLALEVCDRVVYATALSDLAAMVAPPRVALAATDGPLLHRVRRILGQPVDRQDSAAGWLSACFVVLLAGAVAPVALGAGSPQTTSINDAGATGVRAGVAGGVQQGVASGVPGGIVGGVSAGVPAGVPGGVSNGIAAVYQKPKPVQTADERALDQARTDEEYRRLIDEYKARIAELEDRLSNQMAEYKRAREAYDRGEVPKATLRDYQAKVTAYEAEIAQGKADLAGRKDDVKSRLQNLETVRDKAALAEIADVAEERARKQELAKGAGDAKFSEPGARQKAEMLQSVKRTIEQEKIVADRAQANSDVARLRALEKAAAFEEVTSPTGTVRDGDLLVIGIKGEPDLPDTFVVRDRTIRFPFLGEIKVGGLTTKQVRDDVAKMLLSRKLAAADDVSVILRRSK